MKNEPVNQKDKLILSMYDITTEIRKA
jgi:hypothetical protein